MTEFSTETIKDVQHLNVAFTLEALLKIVAEGIKHVGEDIQANRKNNPEQGADEEQLAHWLGMLGNTLSSVTKALQINNIAREVSSVDKDSMPEEEAAELKQFVTDSKPVQDMVMIMRETPEQAMERLMMKALVEGLGLELSKDDMEALLNGN